MHVIVRRSLVVPVVALAWVAVPAGAQQPCAAAEHRQFDFWLGEWEVRNAAGAVAGTNHITSILGGCVLLEQWEGVRGGRGTSYNVYDAARGRWHQTWVDDRGTLLLLDGGFREGTMVLEGETRAQDGGRVTNRITWSVVDGNKDRVRQLWEVSSDDGATWRTVFDGLYVRK